MSTVSGVSPLPTASDPTKAAELAKLAGFDRQTKKTLDQSDFLKLLSTQLANQDPLSPSSDLDSISQMATFSSVEQMGDLVTSLKSFIVTQDFASAQNMLGKYVTVSTDSVSKTADGSTVTETVRTSGQVTSVGYNDVGVSVIRIGDRTYSPADVTGISTSAAEAAAGETVGDTDFGTASGLMGRVVTVTQDASTTTASGAPLAVKVSTKGVVTAFGSDAEGNPTITIGGKVYPFSQVTAVQAAKSSTTA